MPAMGEVIGDRYELRGQIASHGMAVVYQAYDRRCEREVRIKWHRGVHDRTHALLRREARLLALLAERTAGTLVCHELVEHQGGLYQIAEHVRGVWLREWEAQKPSPQRILSLYAHLAQVLHEIHAADVVLRDLKPAFVMVLEANDPVRHPARIKIVELELAVRITEPDTLTAKGQLVGTPLSMSPEAMRGQGATSATDVFALGCMLVEALTGKRPWEIGQGSSVELLRGRLFEPPDLHSLTGSALGDLVSAMLARSPEARPSAAEVARALASFADA